jgi:iron complex outermembrane receptor protein
MVTRYLWTGSACLIVGVVFDAARAQQVASGAAAEDNDQLVEIVITAQKRVENLEEVPVAVTALTEQTRELLGIKTVQDITDFTPSLVYYNDLDRLTLRGVGRLTNNAGSEPGVATYVDGFYVSSNILVGVSDLFNSRVEILRGPQGTLYGRNAVGGAIDTIDNRPTDEWSGEIRSTVANFDRTVIEGTFSGPIADGWKFRITGSDTQQNRGYFQNIGFASSEGGVAHDKLFDVQLQGTAGPVDIWVRDFIYNLNETDRLLNINTPYDTTTFFGPSNLIPSATFGYTVSNPAINNPFVINTDTPSTLRYDNTNLVIAHLSFHMGGADLSYIGGYYQYNLTLLNDADNTSRQSYPFALPGGSTVAVSSENVYHYAEYHHYYTNELNLTSTGGGPFQWIVGVYDFNEHLYEPFALSDQGQTQLLQPVFTVNSFAPLAISLGGGAPNPGLDYVTETGRLHTQSDAAYGQIDWKFVDHFKLTAGLRYSSDRKVGVATQRFVTWNPLTSPFAGDVTPAVTGFPAGTTPAIMNVSKNSDGLTGTAGVEWQPERDTLLYVKYSRGFKAGSLNLGQVSFSNPQSTTVGPEQIDAFEAGFKRQWGGYQVNAALYYYNYEDAQVPVQVLGTGNVAVTQFVNLAKLRDYGAELETIAQPIKPLTLIFNYSYLNTKILNSVCFIDPVDPFAKAPGATPCPGGATPTGDTQSPVGSHFLGSPPNKFSASASYRFTFRPGSLSLTAIDSFRDKSFSFVFDRSYWQTPSYNLLNGRIIWTGTRGNYDLIGYITNATNRLAVTDVGASATSTGINRAFGYLPPRTYGAEIQYRFGAGY